MAKSPQVGEGIAAEGAEVKDLTGKVLVPGLVDMHVHLREPGYESKKTSRAARARLPMAASRAFAPCPIPIPLPTMARLSNT